MAVPSGERDIASIVGDAVDLVLAAAPESWRLSNESSLRALIESLDEKALESNAELRENGLVETVRSSKHSRKLFECGVCSKTFTRQTNLRRHQREQDHGAKSSVSELRCKICSSVFKRQSDLARHHQVHETICTASDHEREQTTTDAISAPAPLLAAPLTLPAPMAQAPLPMGGNLMAEAAFNFGAAMLSEALFTSRVQVWHDDHFDIAVGDAANPIIQCPFGNPSIVPASRAATFADFWQTQG
eukprot:a509051_771.p1 GENE.a509051_771~~a509051_771.p1  ORF type:complete len:259 (-),score=80.01 a509051_771:93-827(-)